MRGKGDRIGNYAEKTGRNEDVGTRMSTRKASIRSEGHIPGSLASDEENRHIFYLGTLSYLVHA